MENKFNLNLNNKDHHCITSSVNCSFELNCFGIASDEKIPYGNVDLNNVEISNNVNTFYKNNLKSKQQNLMNEANKNCKELSNNTNSSQNVSVTNKEINEYLRNRVCQIFVDKEAPLWLEPCSNNKNLVGQGRGSGFVINVDFHEEQQKHKYIVTNHHVVSDFVNIHVSFPIYGKKKFKCKVACWCPESDIAILKVICNEDIYKSLEVVELGVSDDIIRGDVLYAAGFPLGMENIQLSEGKLSGYNNKNCETFLQHTCLLNPGNSGGPLLRLNDDNSLVAAGVNNAIIKNAQGIDFSIPIERVKIIVREFVNISKTLDKEKRLNISIKKINFGIITQPLHENLKKMNNYSGEGLYISYVIPESIADKSGIKPGFILSKIEGNSIDDIGQVSAKWSEDKVSIYSIINRKAFGDVLNLETFDANNGYKTHNITLNGSDPYKVKVLYSPIDPKPDFIVIAGHMLCDISVNTINILRRNNPLLVQYMSPEMRTEKKLILTKLITGLESTAIQAEQRTLFPGNIIKSINGTIVNSVKDVKNYLKENKNSEYFVFRTDFNTETCFTKEQLKREDEELCEEIRRGIIFKTEEISNLCSSEKKCSCGENIENNCRCL